MGKPARGSNIPCVKAYFGGLPPHQPGVEFTTTIAHAPKYSTPYKARWYYPNTPEVRLNVQGYAVIPATVTKIVYVMTMAADFDTIEWMPQAILNVPLDHFSAKCSLMFFEGRDDLDEYVGANLQLPDGRPYALRHYQGYPVDTVTIYLPFEIRDADEISKWVRAIIAEWHLTQKDIRWERRHGLANNGS